MSRSPSSARLIALSRYCGSSAVSRAPCGLRAGAEQRPADADHEHRDEQQTAGRGDGRSVHVGQSNRSARRTTSSQVSTPETSSSTMRGEPGLGQGVGLGRAQMRVASVSKPVGASSSVAGSSFIVDSSTSPAPAARPGAISGRSMRSEASPAVGAEHAGGVVEPAGHRADRDAGSPHRLGAEVHDVGDDQQREGLVEAVEHRRVERQEHHRERDHDAGQGEAGRPPA